MSWATTPEATAVIEKAAGWINKLAELGRASNRQLTAFAFPHVELPPEAMYDAGMALDWPLEPTIRSLRKLVTTDEVYPGGGLQFPSDLAAALRDLRSAAAER
jgi:hypothetical protein